MIAEIISQGARHYDEHGISVQWVVKPYVLDFTAKEGTRQDDGTVIYSYFDESGQQEFTSDFSLGERFVNGSIKWDGCSHLWLGDEDGYLHLCGGWALRGFVFVLRDMFALAAKSVPSFDAECANLDKFAEGV